MLRFKQMKTNSIFLRSTWWKPHIKSKNWQYICFVNQWIQLLLNVILFIIQFWHTYLIQSVGLTPPISQLVGGLLKYFRLSHIFPLFICLMENTFMTTWITIAYVLFFFHILRSIFNFLNSYFRHDHYFYLYTS